MNSSRSQPVDDGRCFGCGPFSEKGLKLRFRELEDKSVESDLTIGEAFQGWQGIAHGGIVALVLDEAMAYAAAAHGALGMTAALSMRFRGETPLGVPLRLRGRVKWVRRNVYAVEAELTSADGTLLASADGSFVAKGRLEPGQRLGWERLEPIASEGRRNG